jgi:hypothetical protein
VQAWRAALESKGLAPGERESEAVRNSEACFMHAGAAFVSAADLRNGGEPRPLPDPRHGEILSALLERGVREDRARKLLLAAEISRVLAASAAWACKPALTLLQYLPRNPHCQHTPAL